jgi:predicted N-acetyltransferase YhbS
MNIEIRITTKADFKSTENLTRESFWNLYNPGCSEHFILHRLRESKSYVEGLDLIAINKGEIIGHIISTKAKVTDARGNEFEVLCVGPFAVSPKLQSKGIGAKLLNDSITKAKKMGFSGMILFGNPHYYSRFGFVNAQQFGITTKDGQNFDPFMVLELGENRLAKVKGAFFEDNAFEFVEADLDEFDKHFPPKKKGKPKIDISHN